MLGAFNCVFNAKTSIYIDPGFMAKDIRAKRKARKRYWNRLSICFIFL